MKRLLIPLLIIFVATGCKVSIKVPTGGSVESLSGAYSCAAGETCVIEVNDTFFNEQFAAIPEEGYDFVQWKKRENGFCGGEKGKCHLFTTFFADYPELMEILESDAVYYLQPVFRKADISKERAAACFNPSRWSRGARLVARYRGPEGGVIKFVERVRGSDRFNGFKTTRIVRDAETTRPDTTWTNQQYITISKTKRRLNSRGIVTENTSPEVSKHTMTFNSGRLFRFDLAAGQSYNADHGVELVIELEDLPIPLPELPPGTDLPPGFELPDPGEGFVERSDWRRKVTYIGRQTVTVPAGTFETCRFETQNRVTFSSGLVERFTEVTWISVGTGVLIKDSIDGLATVLLSGSLNGEKLGEPK